MKIDFDKNIVLHTLRQVINGTGIVRNHVKFRVLGIVTATIHLLFLYLFMVSHCYFLSIYNVFAVAMYLYGAFIWVRDGKFEKFYYATIVEILLHSVIASILLDWDKGFMTYTLAIIPLSYYFGFAIPELKDQLKVSFAISGAEVICYLGVLAITDVKNSYPLLTGFDISTLYFLKFFNRVIALMLFIITSMLFSLEIRYMQRKWELENHQLVNDAGHDALTGLMNRRGIESILEQAQMDSIRYNKAFGIAMCDIDHFKVFNDTYGHDCGDEVLIAIAKSIIQNVRDTDAVCRWGGEEILVLIKGKIEEIPNVAERIRKGVEEMKFNYGGKEVNVTVTVGLSICSGASGDEKHSIKEMIEVADSNLYYGKHHGRNCVIE